MQNKRSAIIVSVVVLIIVAVVIGLFVSKARDKSTNNKTNTTSSASSSSTDNVDTNSSSNEAVSTNTVAIKDFAFSPATITVKVGTTVTWTNQDSAAHTVTSDSNSKESFDSGSMAKDKTFTHTFNTAGTFDYICTFHPDMTGKVKVTE